MLATTKINFYVNSFQASGTREQRNGENDSATDCNGTLGDSKISRYWNFGIVTCSEILSKILIGCLTWH